MNASMETRHKFDEFWNLCPLKIKKREAWGVFLNATSEGAKIDEIISGMRRYTQWLSESDKDNWRPQPASPANWLRDWRWEDEYEIRGHTKIVTREEYLKKIDKDWERKSNVINLVG